MGFKQSNRHWRGHMKCLRVAVFALLCAFIVTPACAALSFVQNFGSTGTDSGQFQIPFCVTVDSAGNVYVADQFNNRIDRFNPANFEGTFASFGTSGRGNRQFDHPTGITLDSDGNVYVADQPNNRIVELATVPEPCTVPLLLAAAGPLMLRRRRSRAYGASTTLKQLVLKQVTLIKTNTIDGASSFVAANLLRPAPRAGLFALVLGTIAILAVPAAGAAVTFPMYVSSGFRSIVQVSPTGAVRRPPRPSRRRGAP